MPVVVSDAAPLHYLTLVGRESILQRLYEVVVVPPAVLEELSHPAAPQEVSNWAKQLPHWVRVVAPVLILTRHANLGRGEREALALTIELRADLILLDDKAARRIARNEHLKVKGTLGVIADAASAKLLDFAATVRELQLTSMHLEKELVEQVLREQAQRSQDGA